jgi:uncharacterized protein (DUF58 family)
MNFRVVTLRGWGWLIASLILLMMGLTQGWLEMLGLGVAGLVSFGFATLYAFFRHAHQVSFTLPHSRVVVGSPAELIVSVVNPTNRSLQGLDIFIPVGAEELSSRVPRLRREQTEEIVLPLPTSHRGELVVGPARIVRADPLGLISREVITEEQRTLYIHPQTISLMSMSTGFVRDLEGTPTPDLTDNDLSFHALREYVPGDDRRNIHWKSTAKTGQFMVRQFEQTRRSHLMIVPDTSAGAYPDDATSELAISVSASLGLRALRDTRDVTVLVSEQATPRHTRGLSSLRAAARDALSNKPESAGHAQRVRALSTLSAQRMLDDFSGVTIEQSSPSLGHLTQLASVQAADVSVVFIVTSTQAQAKDIHSASVPFPAGTEVVVICCAPEVSPQFRRIGRLSVMTVGRLDDVKQLLGKQAMIS